jgi:outer membrane protein assembly factor BamB
MRTHRIFAFGIALFALLVSTALCGAQTWTTLTNAPPAPLGTALLLTDGTVMAQGMATTGYATGNWYRLTPSSTGSYINGTWSTLAAMPSGYSPLYYASAVLPDGRLVTVGGEYNNGAEAETNLGAIYNPVTNSWTSITPPSGWTAIGDAASVVLPNGTFMIGNCGVAGTECTNQTYQAQLNATSLTWTIIGSGNGKADQNSEEGWELLQSGDVLVVDVWDGTNSEVFNPSTSEWASAGSTAVSLVNTTCTEIGPAVLRPEGSVFAVGGTSNTAIYTTSTGVWSAGPTVPSSYGVEDGPAAILPDGNVLIDVGPQSPCYSAPSSFYEFNGSSLTAVPGPSRAADDPTYVARMLVLPTGQILFTDGSTTTEIYTASGTYESAWQPTITSVATTLTAGSTNNVIEGTQFNGLSQGAMYGDDAQTATNYPLVRITNNATGDIVYCKTHNHSTMGVATGSATVSTEFDIPTTIGTGASTLAVVANGIPSAAVSVTVDAQAPVNWPMFGFTAEGNRYNSYETGIGASNVSSLTGLWSLVLRAYSIAPPVVYNGVLYTGSQNGNEYALNATTGAEVWTVAMGSEVLDSSVAANGVVYVATGGTLHALNASTGAQLWTWAGACCTPVVSGEVVYISGTSNNFYALSATTGAQLWSYNPGFTPGAVSVANGIVYLGGSASGSTMVALNATTGAELWSFTASGSPGLPVVAGSVVYLGSSGGPLYALNASTGAELWSFSAPASGGNAVVANGVVYYGAYSTLYAVNATTGKEMWSFAPNDEILSALAVANGIVYFWTYGKTLYAVNASTGAQLATFTEPDPSGSPIVVDGVVYVTYWAGEGDNWQYLAAWAP